MKKIFYGILIVALFSSAVLACTMIMVARDGVVLAGNNEDWKNPNTYMWFVPAKGKYHGRVCFGFDRGFGFTQGGMNDQGLFIDGNAISPTNWQADKSKKTLQFPVMDYVLANCATVDDVEKVFKEFNHPSLERARFPVADATGESAMVEWSKEGLKVVRKSKWYQISTNFVQSDYKDPKDYPCDRYHMADKILSESGKASSFSKASAHRSVDLVRKVLSATHSEYQYPTVYSYICDLKNKKVYLYNFHNFEEAYLIDLATELKKGRKSYFIPDLFQVKTQAARLFERYSDQE